MRDLTIFKNLRGKLAYLCKRSNAAFKAQFLGFSVISLVPTSFLPPPPPPSYPFHFTLFSHFIFFSRACVREMWVARPYGEGISRGKERGRGVRPYMGRGCVFDTGGGDILIAITVIRGVGHNF